MSAGRPERRLPIGAELTPAGAHFRVWAPKRARVEVVIEGGDTYRLAREDEGYFAGVVAGAREGTRYRFRLDARVVVPDPASRFQPEGPHGPSAIVDPSRFRWTDAGFRGASREGQILYEMHVGTFTREGTWAAAAERLPNLAGLGVTLIEMMPVAEFPGAFGWGYDGVALFAPMHAYGSPDDLRRFVDRAHALGVGVILDVVYNHLGPDGNYLAELADDYFTDRYETDWGAAVNFDGEGSRPVRELFVSNAGYWIDEFHLDGLRLDATQNIYDERGNEHVLREIVRRAHDAAGARRVVVIGENEPQDARLVRPIEAGGYGLDALWNDDFHHTALVALTGRREAYYTDYLGSPQELVSAMKWGTLYQGQRYAWQKKRRGTPALDLPPSSFVTFLENHDQVANSGRGERLHRRTSPGRYRAMTALMLLGPGTPMLFQGQEFAAGAPFLYFADHEPELGALVKKGRGEFLAQFPSLAGEAMQARLADPGARATFERCKLDWSERERNEAAYLLHADLIALRSSDPAFAAPRSRGVDGAVLGEQAFASPRSRGVDGAVLGEQAFALRFFAGGRGDRLLLINLGADRALTPAPEPLLAPPEGLSWTTLWSSEDPRYGGSGCPPIDTEEGFFLPGEHAAVLGGQ